MHTLPRRSRLAALGVAVMVLGVVAVPVLGQGAPTRVPDQAAPEATEKPGNGPPADKPGKGPKTEKADRPVESPVELRGRVGTRTVEGDTVYTLTVGTTVVDLAVGPPWFWGEDHPLESLVGRTVTVQGHQAQGSSTVDVHVVDGTTLRAPGRPAWAGGPGAVGEDHPGWKPWKAERGHGRPPWAGPRTPETPGE